MASLLYFLGWISIYLHSCYPISLRHTSSWENQLPIHLVSIKKIKRKRKESKQLFLGGWFCIFHALLLIGDKCDQTYEEGNLSLTYVFWKSFLINHFMASWQKNSPVTWYLIFFKNPMYIFYSRWKQTKTEPLKVNLAMTWYQHSPLPATFCTEPHTY